MIENSARKLTNRFVKKHIVEVTDAEICQYGLEVILSTGVNFLSVILIGFLLGKIGTAFCYFWILATVRTQTGGYHANTYCKCELLYVVVYLLLLLCSCQFEKIVINPVIYALALIINTLFVGRNTPVTKKEISDEQKRRGKKRAVAGCLIWNGISLGILHYYPAEALMIGNSLLAVSLFMLIGKGGEKKDEK